MLSTNEKLAREHAGIGDNENIPIYTLTQTQYIKYHSFLEGLEANEERLEKAVKSLKLISKLTYDPELSSKGLLIQALWTRVEQARWCLKEIFG